MSTRVAAMARVNFLHNWHRNSGRWWNDAHPPILNRNLERDARQKRSTQSKEARRRDAIKAISEGTEMANATYDELTA